MLSGLLAPKLNEILSKYFTNFDANKLDIGAGNATLTDLALKTDVLTEFNLPFKVLGGRVGSVYIDIGILGALNIARGSTAIIKLTLKDVYILAVPPTAVPYDKEKAEADALKQKRSELESIVKKQKAAGEAARGSSSKGGLFDDYTSNILLGIVNNVKISVENIHIRYEDDKLKAGSPFSFGVILGGLEAVTCDRDWEPSKVGLDPTFFKILELKSYGFYWNSHEKNMISAKKDTSPESLNAIVKEMKAVTASGNNNLEYGKPQNVDKEKAGPLSKPPDQLRFFDSSEPIQESMIKVFPELYGNMRDVLGPLETKIKAMVTLKPDKLEEPFSLPKAHADIEMPELKIGLSNEQFGEALLLVESFEAMQRAKPYQKFRPVNTPVKGNAKKWWQFAKNCLMEEAMRRKQNISWDHYKKHRELVKKYTVAYPPVADETATKEQKAEAQKLEDQLDNISIMTVRNKIDLTVTRQKKKKADKKGSKWNPLNWVRHTDDSLSDAEKKEILTKDMTEAEKAEFTTILEEKSKPITYPKDVDFVEFSGKVDLAKTTLNIVNKPEGTDKVEKVLNFGIDKFSISAETHPVKEGVSVYVTMNGIGITGLEVDGAPPPQFLKSITEDADTEFLSVTYVKNPFDSNYGSKIEVLSEKMDVIYHAPTIQKLVDTFTWPEHVELSKTTAAISSSIENFKQSSLESMQDIIKNTKEIDLNIRVIAPRILIPENGELTGTQSVLIANLGTISVKNVPHPGSDKADLKALAGPPGDMRSLNPALEKLIYNEYAVKLTNLEVLIALSGESLGLSGEKPDKMAKVRKPVPILKKGEIVVQVNQSKITTDPRFIKFKVDVKVPLLDLDIIEKRLFRLLHLALTFPIPVKTPAKPKMIDIKNDPKANYDKELQKQIKAVGSVESETPAKSDDATQGIPSDFDPQTATQLTNLFCHINIQGVKLRVSKMDAKDEKAIPVLTFALGTMHASIQARTYVTNVTATLASLIATYSEAKMIGYDGPINLLETPTDSETPLLTFHLSMLDGNCPKQESGSVKMLIDAVISQLSATLHQEALVSLLGHVDRVMKELDKIKASKQAIAAGSGEGDKKADAIQVVGKSVAKKPQGNPNDLDLKVTAVLESFTLQLQSEATRILLVTVQQLAAEYDDGAVKSNIIVKLDALQIINMDPTAKYRKFFSVTGEEKLLFAQVVIYKALETRGDTDPDLEITFNLGHPRVIVTGSFLGNVMNFVNHFQHAKKAIVQASTEASKKAIAAVKEAYKNNQAKIQLRVKLGTPEFFMPSGSASSEALVGVLGEFEIKNVMSAVPSNDADKNAIIDTATISLTGFWVGRAILDDNADIKAKSVFLEPATFSFDFIRNLSSSWYPELPQFKIVANFEEAMARLSTEDLVFMAACKLELASSLLACMKPNVVKDIRMGGSNRSIIIGSTGPGGSENVDKPEEKPATKDWLFSFQGTFQKYGLVVYTAPTSLESQTGDVPRDINLSVGELSLKKISASGDVWSNMDIIAKIEISDILILDSRSTASIITDFIRRKTGPGGVTSTAPMIGVNFNMTTESSGEKLIDVALESTGVENVLNFVFIKALVDILKQVMDSVPKLMKQAKECKKSLSGEDEASTGDEIVTVGSTDVKVEETKSLLRINGKIKINEINFLVLEEAKTTDTNAIEFTLAGTFDVNSNIKETHGNGEINLGLATTNFRTRNDKKLAEIIPPAAVKINLDLTPERKIDVKVLWPELSVKISAGNILLFSKVATAAGKAFTKPEEKAVERDYSDVWNAKENGDQDYWFLQPEYTGIKDSKAIHLAGGVKKVDVKRVIQESISLKIESLAISLEVGAGNLTTPLIILEGSLETEVTNFTSDLLASGKISTSAAYNNTKIGVWEYFIEPTDVPKKAGEYLVPASKPWEIKFEASKPVQTDDSPSPPINVGLVSEETLELALSKTGVQALTKIGETFAASANATISDEEIKSSPYTFINDLGTPITLKIEETSPFVYLEDGNEKYGDINVDNGSKIGLGLKIHIVTTTETDKALGDRVLNISIPEYKFSQAVNVGKTQTRFFPIDKKSSSGESEGIIIDVVNEGFAIVITARSLVQIFNELDVPVEIHASKGPIGTVEPSKVFNVSMVDVYESPEGLFTKPKGYGLSPIPLKWTKLLTDGKKLKWSATSADESGKSDAATITVIAEQKPAVEGNTDKATNVPRNFAMSLRCQVIINNLLPFDVMFVPEKGTEFKIEPGQDFNAFCMKAGTKEKDTANPSNKKGVNINDYEFTLTIPNFRGQSWTSQLHVKPSDELLTSIIFKGEDKKQICLGYQTPGKEDGNLLPGAYPITISLYCSYWMVNYTGLNLSYKSSDGSNIVKHPAGEQGPILIGPEKSLGKSLKTPSTLIKCENGSWSDPLPLDANTGIPVPIFLKVDGREYQMTLSCELGNCGLTRIVTLSARYTIINSCPYSLNVEETDVSKTTTKAPPLQSIPYWPQGAAMRIKVQVDGTNQFSPDVSYNETNNNLLRIKNKYGGIRACIIQSTTKTTITFSEYSSAEVPLLIVNDTKDQTLEFNQVGEMTPGRVDAKKSILYAWDNFNKEKKLQWTPTGASEPVTDDFSKDKNGEIVKDKKKYKWITFTKYLQRILLLTDNSKLFDSIKKLHSDTEETAKVDVTLALHGLGISVVDNVAGRDILYIRVGSMAPIWESSPVGEKRYGQLTEDENKIVESGFQKVESGEQPSGPTKLEKNIEVDYSKKIIKRKGEDKEELFRHAFRPAAKVNFVLFPSSMSVDVKVNLIQIDNQTKNTNLPVCFNIAPIVQNISTKTEVHPWLASVKFSKTNPSGSSLEIISGEAIVQKFELRVDMALIDAITDFISTDESGKSKAMYAAYSSDYAVGSQKETDYYNGQYEKSASYKKINIFEQINIHKLMLNLTIALGGGTKSNFLTKFLGAGAAIMDKTDEPLDISGLQMVHMRLTPTEFKDQVFEHYKSTVLLNVAKLLLGLDVIGNPVKLLTGLTEGLGTMLIDPFHAAIDGHFVEGLSYGAQGLGKVLGSVTDSLAGITGGVGKLSNTLGLHILGSVVGSVTNVLRAPGKLVSGKIEEKLERLRSPRTLLPNSAVRPYSPIGESLKNEFDTKSEGGRYILYVIPRKHALFLLTEKMAFYGLIKDDFTTLQRKEWGVLLSSVTVRTDKKERTRILFQSKPVEATGWGLHKTAAKPATDLTPMSYEDDAMAMWVFAKIEDAIRNLPPEPKTS